MHLESELADERTTFSAHKSIRLLSMASPARLRGQRISRQELVDEAQQTLKEAGVPNYERASFANQLSKFVVGNSATIFCQLQPKITPQPSSAWVRAYELVSSYVAGANLRLTLDTMNTELGQTKRSLKVSIRSLQDLNDELNDLLMSSEAARPGDDSFTRGASKASVSSASEPPERQIHSPTRVKLIGSEILIDTPDQKKKSLGKHLPPMAPPPDDPSALRPSYPKPLSPKAASPSPWGRDKKFPQ
jgi:hypothetical protein